MIERYGLRPPHHVFKPAGHDVWRGKGDHRAKFSLLRELDRFAAESRGQHAIEAGRRPAALQVPEHDRTRFLSGFRRQRAADGRADAAQTLQVSVVRHLDERLPTALGKRAFGHFAARLESCIQ